MARPHFVAVAGPQSFRWFLASMFVSSFGRNAYNVACAWILVASGYGLKGVATFFAVVSLVELMASPAAGWICDRYDRRRLCLLADGVRSIAAIMVMGILTLGVSSWTIWLSTILFASCDRIALTASQSMIPSMRERISLAKANSVVFFMTQWGSLAAAAFVGIVLHVATPALTFAGIASAFLIAVCTMSLVRSNGIVRAVSCHIPVQKLVLDRGLIELGAIYALLYTGGILVSVVGPSFVFAELGGDAVDFGWLESAWSAGSILGAVLLIPLARIMPLPLLHIVVLSVTALSFAALKLLDLPWVLSLFAVLGALYNLGRVTVEVTLQSTVAPMALGRAKSILHCTGVSFGLALFGIIAVIPDAASPTTTFFGFALIVATGTVALAVIRTRLTGAR